MRTSSGDAVRRLVSGRPSIAGRIAGGVNDGGGSWAGAAAARVTSPQTTAAGTRPLHGFLRYRRLISRVGRRVSRAGRLALPPLVGAGQLQPATAVGGGERAVP